MSECTFPACDCPRYNSRQAAEKLGVHVCTLHRWRKQCQGPHYVQYTKKVVRYSKCALDTFVNCSTGHIEDEE